LTPLLFLHRRNDLSRGGASVGVAGLDLLFMSILIGHGLNEPKDLMPATHLDHVVRRASTKKWVFGLHPKFCLVGGPFHPTDEEVEYLRSHLLSSGAFDVGLSRMSLENSTLATIRAASIIPIWSVELDRPQ